MLDRQNRREPGNVVVAVTANFTADPLKKTLLFWGARLALGPLRVDVSAYNQIFQDLTRPDSLLASGEPGVNCILVRLQDWGRNKTQDVAKTITGAAREFVGHLEVFTQRARRPTILVLCPPSQHVLEDGELSQTCASLEGEVGSAAAAFRGLSVITAGDIADLYPVEIVDDAESDRQGHIPFTSSYWAAIGTMVSRRARTLLQPAHKVIAVDADNTLWNGVVGEVGADQVQLPAGRRTFQEFLRDCKRRGMLLALISKNNEKDVSDVFQRSDMVLRREDFVAWKVNWEPKSQNIRVLAADLDLGLDSFVFLDDNPIECAEVTANCPSVTALCMPPTAEELPRFIRHVWALDLPPATSADSGRTEQYRQQAERNNFRRKAGSFRDFIESLNLAVEVSPLAVEHLDRAAQLTQRTNQFNTTGRRRSVPELASILQSAGTGALLVRVRDRFGDYGEVGLCIFSEADGVLEIENFLLSCRVLGKGVEHRMLAAVGRIAVERGHEWVRVRFCRSERNEPADKFLKAIAAQHWVGDAYRLPAVEAAKISFEPVEANDATDVGDTAAVPQTAPVRRHCDFADIATNLTKVPDIQAAIQATYRTARPELDTAYAAPRNSAEQMLADIWAGVLGLDRVGIHDNFFDLGGDSVLGIQVISKASQAGLGYPLRQQFKFPTIAELVSELNLAKAEKDHAAGATPVPGEVTPSDHPLAKLGKLSVDDLVARLGKSRR